MPELKLTRLALIACKVLWREFAYFASLSQCEIDFFFQPQGLHNDPPAMKKKLQAVIDEVETEGRFDYLVFGYGLCSGGIEGLVSRKTHMVFARAHDCLTFLLGSRQRHEKIYQDHPDAYWYSPGWIETGHQPSRERIEKSFEALKQRYGEEKAEILLPELESWLRNYHKAIYIDLTPGPREKFLAYTEKCAQELGWQLLQIEGDPQLVRKLLSGKWDEKEFLIVPPGAHVQFNWQGGLIGCQK